MLNRRTFLKALGALAIAVGFRRPDPPTTNGGSFEDINITVRPEAMAPVPNDRLFTLLRRAMKRTTFAPSSELVALMKQRHEEMYAELNRQLDAYEASRWPTPNEPYFKLIDMNDIDPPGTHRFVPVYGISRHEAERIGMI